ncbi:MAG: OmpA family protein [Bacteroidetes bacterium]|nr:OmpA family protein [Bacteroidota bacterium]MBS1629433.1 OmpA family protein [Bacteroidota bacterium]
MKTLLFVLVGGLMAVMTWAVPHSGSAIELQAPLQAAPSPTDTPSGSAETISPGWLIFEAGSSNLSAPILQSLNQLGKQMQTKPAARVVIVTQGGGTGTQQKLNETRANTVVQYLVANYGIPATQLASTVSDGIDDPNAVNFHQEP